MAGNSDPKNENAFINLLFNIILPVLILNRLGAHIGALPSLFLALSAPLAYLLWDLWQKKKINYFSVLGLINVSLTGGLAVLQIGGFWFWIKEAAFPTLVGLFVMGSRWSSKPFIETLILNPQVVNKELIQSRITERGHEQSLFTLTRTSTVWLSGSFFISATLNFFLAQRIFTPIDPVLSGEARSLALNDQIAEMTKWSFPVIFLPSVLFLMVLMFFLIRRLKRLTGLTLEEIIPSK